MDSVMSYLAEGFDLPILDWIAANLQCGFLDFIMPIITVLGDAGIFWILLSLLFLCLPKYRQIGLGMAFSLIFGLLLCNIYMKPTIARIRPYDYQLEHFGKVVPLLIEVEHDFSFPSGHTIASFEAATVLLLGNKKLGIPAMILASLIAFSRLYLYVHYPTDVITSVILGIGIAYLSVYLAKKAFPLLNFKKRPR